MLQKPSVPVVIVAAMARHSRVVGNQNTLLWHIPEDLKRFKQLTLGHPIIMGRKTFTSIIDILGKPLPERTNIVLTRNHDFSYEGVLVAHTLEEAFAKALAESPAEIHIGGGSEIWQQALPYVDRLHLTLVDDEPTGDSFFPDFEADFTINKEYPPQTHESLSYQWVDYERKQS